MKTKELKRTAAICGMLIANLAIVTILPISVMTPISSISARTASYSNDYLSESIRNGYDKYLLSLESEPAYVAEFLSFDFIESVIRQSNVAPSIVIAQAIIESGWGKYADGNNYFGIKSFGATDSRLTKQTFEYVDNVRISCNANFRSYESLNLAIEHHSIVLQNRFNINSTDSYESALPKLSGYATDPQYISKCKYVIDRYNLHAIDSMKFVIGSLLN
jgi:hypothetical protein